MIRLIMFHKKRSVSAIPFLVLFFLLQIQTISLFAVEFSELNISSDNRLLFKADFESRNAVYVSTLQNNSIQQLTAFPEKIYTVDNGRTLLVLNKFGVTRIPVSGGLPVQIPGYPSFTEGNLPLKGRLQEIAVSKDGRWIAYIEPTSPAYGTLFILNTSNGTKQAVTERIELPAADFPVKWSTDSRVFVYAKNNNLYYFPIISDLSVLIDERFRLIGTGSINSIEWGKQGDFFYFSGNTLYSVRNPELFTRTIYGDFLSIGNAVINLPFEFDHNFDNFWIAPDSGAAIINKRNKGVFLFRLGESAHNTLLLHSPIISGAENMNVLWSPSGNGMITYKLNKTIIIEVFEITGSNTRIGRPLGYPVLPESNGLLSPDGFKAVFWGEQGLELWDLNNLRLIQKLSDEPVLSCAWINNDRFIIGNNRLISEINISGTTATQRRICLSGADTTGFEAITRGQSRVLARAGNEWYATDTRSGWIPVNEPQVRPVSLATDRYRVYFESNTPMIRNLQTSSASSVLPRQTPNRAYPERSSIRIALCFDLYDDDTGLYQVLSALRRNNIRATFFLNGEFIRRNPAGTIAVAESGHETGSMFYAPIDLSSSRYRITREFIIQGLARNEDEFQNVTGKQLGLLWHPPFYRTSDFISSSASSANYIYIPRTLDLQDWLSGAESARLNLREVPPSQMIEQIVEQRRNGAVIPIRIGMLPGGRDEYLYQRIDVLLDALLRAGIEVVPVSAVSR